MRGLWFAAALVLSWACQRESRSPEPAPSSGFGEPQQVAAPRPEQPGPDRGAPAAPVAPGTNLGEIASLVQAANRKMMHDDGPGCLAELDKLKRLDEKLESTLVATRAQCEMLSGRCQAGKQTLTDYYVREMNMSRDLARTSVESVASMRCRGGDETERDRLLRALRELVDGAYMSTRSDCAANVQLVKQLLPRVPPAGPDDAQLHSSPRSLFHTGAACLARAGNCKAAFQVYRDEFPSAGLDKLPERDRASVIEKSFRSAIERCKDATL